MKKDRQLWGERIVDNLMDKLADRLSATEIIKANVAAEAAEAERLRAQVAQYQREMDEIRKKSVEISEQLNRVEGIVKTTQEETKTNLEETRTKLEETKTTVEETKTTIDAINAAPEAKADPESSFQDLQNYLDEHFEKNQKNTHDIGVQVYRNIQAFMSEEQKKQVDDMLEQIRQENDQLTGSIAEETASSLQRALEGIIGRQKDTDHRIAELQLEMEKYRLGITVSIITLVAVLGGVALLVLQMLGITLI